MVHRPSVSAPCEIFPDQGSKPCLLHSHVDSLLLGQQGSPLGVLFGTFFLEISVLFSIVAAPICSAHQQFTGPLSACFSAICVSSVEECPHGSYAHFSLGFFFSFDVELY